MSLPDLMTAEQVADALGCDEVTVQQRALAGDLPGVKYGRGWVFPREALLEALNRQARLAAEARLPPPKPAAVAVTPAATSSRRKAPVPLPIVPQADPVAR